jgi:hypothetical protein
MNEPPINLTTHIAALLNKLLPQTLPGKFIFSVVLATAVLMSAISFYLNLASFVFGLFALPILCVISAFLLNFAILFMQDTTVEDECKPAVKLRSLEQQKIAKNRLIHLFLMAATLFVFWPMIHWLASLVWRDYTLYAGSVAIENARMVSKNSRIFSDVLKLIPYRKDPDADRPFDVASPSAFEILSSDTEVPTRLVRDLATPSLIISKEERSVELAKLDVDGAFLRVLTNRNVVTFKEKAIIDLRTSVQRDPFLAAARSIIFEDGAQIIIGARKVLLIAEQIRFGSGVSIVFFPRSSDGGDLSGGQPATGDTGQSAGSLTLVSLIPAAGTVKIDLRGEDGRKGRQGNEPNPVELPQRRPFYDDYYKYIGIAVNGNTSFDESIKTCKELRQPRGYYEEKVPPSLNNQRLDRNVIYFLRRRACRLTDADRDERTQRDSRNDREKTLSDLVECERNGCLWTICLRDVSSIGQDGEDSRLDSSSEANKGKQGGAGGASGSLFVATLSGDDDPISHEIPPWIELNNITQSTGGAGGEPGPPQRGGLGAPPIPSTVHGCAPVPEGNRGKGQAKASGGPSGPEGTAKKPILIRLQSP